jgi:DNA (cytosine-5)-methyltransferase 1
MANLTSADLFSGCGGVAQGMKQAGFTHDWGLEFDPAIAEIYRANHGQVYVQNILDADPMKFEKVDLLHASPVCKSFSTANANKGEKQVDIDCAIKTAQFIQVLQPPTFTIENVQAYGKSKAFNIQRRHKHKPRGYFLRRFIEKRYIKHKTTKCSLANFSIVDLILNK